jgi:hypothetical protein
MIKGKFLSRASMMTPLTKEEERLLENYDIDPEALKSVLGVSALKHSDKKSLARAPLTEPTCTIDGLHAGYAGKGAKTIVTSRAFANWILGLCQTSRLKPF